MYLVIILNLICSVSPWCYYFSHMVSLCVATYPSTHFHLCQFKELMMLSVCLCVCVTSVNTLFGPTMLCHFHPVCDIDVCLTETVKKTHEVIQPPRYVEHSYRRVVVISLIVRCSRHHCWDHFTPYYDPPFH